MQTTLIQRGPWTARTLLAIVAATLAVAALLTSQAKPAHAAPPTLNAGENPVTIMYGSSTKNITLSWNLNGYPKASLSVQENGGPVVAAFAVVSQTGSLPLTVTHGKSYTATLIDPAANGPLASLQITTKRPNINVDIDIPPIINNPDVAGDIANCVLRPCITSVAFQPHGTYAAFTVKTTKAAKFQMAICGAPFTAGGGCANPVSGIFNLSYVTEWNSHVMGLAPNTTYHYLARAEDQQDNVKTRTGTFETLRRQVDVTFADVTVTDDSDDLSPCDCSLVFKAGDQVAYWGDAGFEGIQISTGQEVHPNVTITVLGASDSLLLRVMGRDNDKTGAVYHDCSGVMPALWTSGSDSCWDWDSTSRTIGVANPGFGEEFTESFGMSATGSPLKFTVSGTFKVTYVP